MEISKVAGKSELTAFSNLLACAGWFSVAKCYLGPTQLTSQCLVDFTMPESSTCVVAALPEVTTGPELALLRAT